MHAGEIPKPAEIGAWRLLTVLFHSLANWCSMHHISMCHCTRIVGAEAVRLFVRRVCSRAFYHTTHARTRKPYTWKFGRIPLRCLYNAHARAVGAGILSTQQHCQFLLFTRSGTNKRMSTCSRAQYSDTPISYQACGWFRRLERSSLYAQERSAVSGLAR